MYDDMHRRQITQCKRWSSETVIHVYNNCRLKASQSWNFWNWNQNTFNIYLYSSIFINKALSQKAQMYFCGSEHVYNHAEHLHQFLSNSSFSPQCLTKAIHFHLVAVIWFDEDGRKVAQRLRNIKLFCSHIMFTPEENFNLSFSWGR